MAGVKQVLLMIAVVALVGCGSPQGINQTSKVAIGTPIWEFETGDDVDSSPNSIYTRAGEAQGERLN